MKHLLRVICVVAALDEAQSKNVVMGIATVCIMNPAKDALMTMITAAKQGISAVYAMTMLTLVRINVSRKQYASYYGAFVRMQCFISKDFPSIQCRVSVPCLPRPTTRQFNAIVNPT